MLAFVATLSLIVTVSAQDTKKDAEPKIYAKTSARTVAGPVVIRGAEQKASANFAKMLKVDAIDWKTQMVVVISGGTQRTGGYSVSATSLEVKDGKLTVNWKLNKPAQGSIVTQALTMPSLTILVDRFEGEVLFNPKSAPGGVGKKLGADVQRN